MWRDPDLGSVYARCHTAPTAKDPRHVSCAPAVYDSSLYWDGADNLIFRPLSDALGLVTSGRGGRREQPRRGPRLVVVHEPHRRAHRHRAPHAPRCMLPSSSSTPTARPTARGSSTRARASGSTPGFRVDRPRQGQVHVQGREQGRPARARRRRRASIGAAILHAAGYNTSCEQIVYVRPSVFRLDAGAPLAGELRRARSRSTSAHSTRCFARSPRRGDRVRIERVGVAPRRERSARSATRARATTIRTTSSRTRIAASCAACACSPRGSTASTRARTTRSTRGSRRRAQAPTRRPATSLHYQLDTSETLGADWPWAPTAIAKRLGHSYVLDWGDLAHETVSRSARRCARGKTSSGSRARDLRLLGSSATSTPRRGRTSTPTPRSAA